MKAIQFPRIPDDPHSEALLQSVAVLGSGILSSPDLSKRERQFASILLVLGTAPREWDYLYYVLYSEMRNHCQELGEHHNGVILKKGKEKMLDVLNSNIGDLAPHFNAFQLVLFNINEKAKGDPSWEPLSHLLWGLFCSMFDRKDLSHFLDKMEGLILKMTNPNDPSTQN